MAAQRKRLGELVIRSGNPERLAKFYHEVIGLELFASFGRTNFFKIDDDFEGHPQLLAIFAKSHEYSGPQSMHADMADSRSGTLHHFAFSLDLDSFNKERDRLEALGIDFEPGEHPPFGWRSIYLHDPDGNSVELVCYDPSLFDPVLNQRVQPSDTI